MPASAGLRWNDEWVGSRFPDRGPGCGIVRGVSGERSFLAGIVLLILAAGFVVCCGPEDRVAFLLYDDAYYYLGVAHHIAAGAGSTFDGINPTNGYHPLWCWLLLPIFLLAREPGTALRLAAGFWFLLAAAAPLVLWRALRGRTGATGACLAAALFGLQPLLPPGLARPNGLETPLLAVCIGGFLIAWEKFWDRPGSVPPRHAGDSRHPEGRSAFLLGLVLGAVLLARLDAGLLAVAAAILMAASLLPRLGLVASLQRLALLTLGAVIVAGPSFVWNTMRFGHPMPVSGRIVRVYATLLRSGADPSLPEASWIGHAAESMRSIALVFARSAVEGLPGAATLIRHGRILTGFLLIVLVGCFFLAVRFRRRGLTDPLFLLGVFAVLHAVAYAGWLWSPGETSYRLYYFLPLAMLVAASVGAALGPVLEVAFAPSMRAFLAIALLALAGGRIFPRQVAALPATESGAGPVADRYIYGWVRRELPPDAVLGAPDAGKLGYFSGHPVVNLDGLANDQRFLHAVVTNTEDEYLLHSPIRFVLIDRPWLNGFDPSHSATPPARRAGFGETLYRLARRPGVQLRDVPGPPPDWVVVEILRR